MDWTQQWQSNLIKKWGGSVSPDRCSRHTGLAALPHRNIHQVWAISVGTWKVPKFEIMSVMKTKINPQMVDRI